MQTLANHVYGKKSHFTFYVKKVRGMAQEAQQFLRVKEQSDFTVDTGDTFLPNGNQLERECCISEYQMKRIHSMQGVNLSLSLCQTITHKHTKKMLTPTSIYEASAQLVIVRVECPDA